MLPGRPVSIPVQRRIALIALFAMLFSALSPAMAAALFADRPEILRHMLALPAPAPVEAVAHDDGCPHEAAPSAQHGQSTHDAPDGSDHAKHGIFCSLCLTASSVVTLAAATGVVWIAFAAGSDLLPVRDYQAPPPVFFNVRNPRGPPFVLR
jgi:hypothetical protein